MFRLGAAPKSAPVGGFAVDTRQRWPLGLRAGGSLLVWTTWAIFQGEAAADRGESAPAAAVSRAAARGWLELALAVRAGYYFWYRPRLVTI